MQHLRTALTWWAATLTVTGCGAAEAMKSPATASDSGASAAYAGPASATSEESRAVTAGEPASATSPAPMTPSRAKTEAPASTVSSSGTKSTELLAYEATLVLGVYQVDRAITAVLGVSRDVGGQMVLRADDRIVFRVPREGLDAALAAIEKVGDVVHRDVHAEDVGDRYRELEVRIRNARAVRDRLAELLARANSVDDSLKIETELGRVTEELERLSGEFQLLGSRVAYSKVTVLFQARQNEEIHDDVTRLPFPWLDTVGLPKLLDLRSDS